MKTIQVTDATFNALEKDRKSFEKVIGGGKWSITNTVSEWHKIINCFEHSQKKDNFSRTK